MTPDPKADDLVLKYQQTGDSTELLQAYELFIKKYVRLLYRGVIDYRNYDIRRFITCFIPDPELVKNLRRGQFHSAEAKRKAQKVAFMIKQVFNGYDPGEIKSELVILFLECASSYKEVGSTFSNYLFNCFRYRLKRVIDSKMFGDSTVEEYSFKDAIHYSSDSELPEDLLIEENWLGVEPEDQHDLQDPIARKLWLDGITSGPLFKDPALSKSERLVLILAYEDGLDDKQIAQMTGMHHKSIYRIRKRLVDHFREIRRNGDMKWLR